MARRRTKTQSAEAELVPHEENDLKVREVKHTAQWIEQRPVEEPTEDNDIDFDDEDSEDKPRRRTKNAREELRKKLRAQGVSPSTNLRLYIEKYLHSDSNTGGSYAETEFCTKYETTEDHILNKDYVDVARRWGAGKYRITIRMQNKIVDAFDQRISATPTTPMLQHVNPNDPNSPQVIFQMPEGMGGQQPVSVVDPLKQMREAAKFYKEMKQTFEPEGTQPAQPRTEEEILAGAILKQPEVIENVVGSVIKRFGGKGGEDDAPWYADIVRKAVESGQAAQIVQVAIDRIFNGVSNLFPGRQNNGQAEMAQAPSQNQTQSQPGDQQGQLVSGQEVGQVATPDNSSGNVAGDVQGSSNAQAVISPEEQALARLIENCARHVPVQVAFDQLINYADWLNEQAPQYSIDGYLSMFAAMPIENALEFVKTQPNGEQVVSLPHAQEWTAELQRLIKEAGQEEE